MQTGRQPPAAPIAARGASSSPSSPPLTLSPSRRELPATERPEARPTRSGGKLLDVSRPTVWLGDVAWPSELRTPLSFPPKAPLTPAGAGGLVSAIVC